MRNNIVEEYRTRMVMAPQTTALAADDYVLPTAGSSLIVLRCLITMGDAADLTPAPKTADDVGGANATAMASDIPIYVNGVRQTDAKSYAVTAATGNFIVDFIVDPKLIPEGKYIGMSFANSDVGNLLACEIIESVAYKPSVT